LELSTDLLLDSELHLAVQTFKEKVVAMPQQPASTCMSGHTTGAFHRRLRSMSSADRMESERNGWSLQLNTRQQ
jgi:hypothetical protein